MGNLNHDVLVDPLVLILFCTKKYDSLILGASFFEIKPTIFCVVLAIHFTPAS